MPRGIFNAQRGDVEVRVGDDVKLTLRYTLRAMATIQERIGAEAMDKVLSADGNALSDFGTLDILLEAGMLYHHGAFSEHKIDVLNEATGADIEAIGDGIVKSINLSFPAKKAEPAAGESGPAGPTNPASTSTS